MTRVLTFLGGPWGALIGKAVMVLGVVGLIYLAVSNYNEGIRATERNANRTAQLEQVIKDNQELKQKLETLDKKSDQIILETEKKNNAVNERHTEVTHYINTEGQKSNRTSSDVIKNTVRMLNDEE